MDVATVGEFIKTFGIVPPDQPTFVDIGGALPLPVRALPATAPTKTLVVLLHGAVDKKIRALPAFLDYRVGLEAHAHQIAISDPTLVLAEDLSNTWFCGSADTPLQRLLPDFFNAVKEELDLDRVIFVGSSGGGFGALFNSWHVPESLAVVTVPQTNVRRYYERRREIFLESCWPDGADSGSGGPILDLRKLYAEPSSNGIVYIQSALDDFHLHRHALPFLASLPESQRSRTAVKVSYWGKPKHSGAVPLQEWDGWLHAALASPSTSAQDIVACYYASGVESVPAATMKKREQIAAQEARVARSEQSASPSGVSAQEARWAAIVAEAELSREV